MIKATGILTVLAALLAVAWFNRPKEHQFSMFAREVSNPLFATAVDWYSPPPPDLDVRHVISIPSELILSVPSSQRDNAIRLLGNAGIIELTEEDVKHFAAAANPKAILRSLINQKEEKLRFFTHNPIQGFIGRELEQQEATRRKVIEELNLEVNHFREWEDRLNPYLIKAVALNEGTGSFDGKLMSNILVIHHGSLGQRATAMKRVPVVAFLPQKPDKIYTTLSMIE